MTRFLQRFSKAIIYRTTKNGNVLTTPRFKMRALLADFAVTGMDPYCLL
jgi:hypothetical protein